ncbi:TIGR04219 family outer membrane beta-barrel protein [Vibrio sp. SM6]|uniref:TIGR04219 family outer membrane beta-barrel protein n=1 Tax=Vibrio agarilyticus TaxID=2726741 RepID=A0A7X8YGW4_9VIBR|nr:TIGR04219 family outer membrane beta-barrel protein [Vibrio agarilyticus]NLS13463.1 TIGR04219 family outer membrane beta-barrel protein [Vibrio agarilyticus]
MKKYWFAVSGVLAALSFSSQAIAQSSAENGKSSPDIHIAGMVGFDVWQASAKNDEVRGNDDTAAGMQVALETSLPYVPHLKLRYLPVNTGDVQFDKSDVTFYYPLIAHKLMDFNGGLTLSNYADAQWSQPSNGARHSFDEMVFGWYADATIRVPNSGFAIIGEFDFGNTAGIKHADVTAGAQYTVSKFGGEWQLRAGYRVIDLMLTDVGTATGEHKVFVDGWFAGVHYRF